MRFDQMPWALIATWTFDHYAENIANSYISIIIMACIKNGDFCTERDVQTMHYMQVV